MKTLKQTESRLQANINRLTEFAESCYPSTKFYDPMKDPLMVNATYCPTCKKPAKTREEAQLIRELGECPTCDHVRGEMLTQDNDFINEENSLDLTGEEFE
jgi:hypothetical protein